jgi:ABC-type Fe3+/spermidine/putrescine transport system ATPase subunit
MRFEIRRVHDETGITMVYVTHDQAEAMVIADRVAVMNCGRIEQVGTPREIYECPRSRFVAAFIGNANCLPGTLIERDMVRCGDLTLRATPPESVSVGSEVTLCVRPSALHVTSADHAPNGTDNAVSGRVLQQAYLGDYQDLRLELPGGIHVRALAPSREQYEPGDQVQIHFSPGACRIVTE